MSANFLEPIGVDRGRFGTEVGKRNLRLVELPLRKRHAFVGGATGGTDERTPFAGQGGRVAVQLGLAVAELAVPLAAFARLETVFLVELDKSAGIHELLKDARDFLAELRFRQHGWQDRLRWPSAYQPSWQGPRGE